MHDSGGTAATSPVSDVRGSIEALAALIRALETVEGGVHAHCTRVAHNASALAVAIGLGEADLAGVHAAGVLHDVGKMAIAPSTLAKPGPLTAEERIEIERHPTIGANMILAVSRSLGLVADGIRAHHERWDGHGYPLRLAEDAIPLPGRLIAVADAFDALTSARSYRARPLTDEEALAFLRLETGKAFQPALVEQFERLYTSGRLIGQCSSDGVS